MWMLRLRDINILPIVIPRKCLIWNLISNLVRPSACLSLPPQILISPLRAQCNKPAPLPTMPLWRDAGNSCAPKSHLPSQTPPYLHPIWFPSHQQGIAALEEERGKDKQCQEFHGAATRCERPPVSGPAATPSANSLWETMVTACLSPPVHKLPCPTWTPPKGRPHLNLVFSLPQMALFEPNPFSWPPCWMRCTLISENANLCLKPPCRQFPRHSLTVYLFIFMLAKRRKSHGPKMNTNEMPSLASFVIRMKNRISAELQAMYSFPFLSPKRFSPCPFLW